MFKLPCDGNPTCPHCHMSRAINDWARGLGGAEYVRGYRQSVPTPEVAQLTDKQLMLGAVAMGIGTILGQTLLEETDDQSGARVAQLLSLFNQTFNAECTLRPQVMDVPIPPESQVVTEDGEPIPDPDKGTLH